MLVPKICLEWWKRQAKKIFFTSNQVIYWLFLSPNSAHKRTNREHLVALSKRSNDRNVSICQRINRHEREAEIQPVKIKYCTQNNEHCQFIVPITCICTRWWTAEKRNVTKFKYMSVRLYLHCVCEVMCLPFFCFINCRKIQIVRKPKTQNYLHNIQNYFSSFILLLLLLFLLMFLCSTAVEYIYSSIWAPWLL